MNENLDLSGKVVAAANPETGELFTLGNNPEWCSVRIESTVLENDEGFWLARTRIGRIRLQVALAKALMANGMLKSGKELPIKGKIIVRESFEPFYEGQEPKINPRTGELVLFSNNPVFRQTVFTSNENERDCFIKEYYISILTKAVPETQEPVPFDKFMEKEFSAA
jgi:hypothetical protein